MALEDAFALAALVDGASDLPAALARYAALRRPRVTRAIAAANGNAWKYHLRARPLRFAAHSALRLVGAIAPAAMLRQFEWLYGYDITRDVTGLK